MLIDPLDFKLEQNETLRLKYSHQCFVPVGEESHLYGPGIELTVMSLCDIVCVLANAHKSKY